MLFFMRCLERRWKSIQEKGIRPTNTFFSIKTRFHPFQIVLPLFLYTKTPTPCRVYPSFATFQENTSDLPCIFHVDLLAVFFTWKTFAEKKSFHICQCIKADTRVETGFGEKRRWIDWTTRTLPEEMLLVRRTISFWSKLRGDGCFRSIANAAVRLATSAPFQEAALWCGLKATRV